MEGYIEKEVVIDGVRINALVNEDDYNFKIKYQKCSNDFHHTVALSVKIQRKTEKLSKFEIDELNILLDYIDTKLKYKCKDCDYKKTCLPNIFNK